MRRLTQALEFRKKNGDDGLTEDWLFLALAHHQLGHADEARNWLAKAKQAPARPSTRPAWLAKLRHDLLLAEAEAAVK